MNYASVFKKNNQLVLGRRGQCSCYTMEAVTGGVL